jgi:hypothetical protein
MPAPTSTSNSQNFDVEDAFLEECNIHAVGEIARDNNTPILDCFTQEFEEIYEKLNP